jgi:glycine/D-amino acid oxidase-like deaminating enzyme/nitrite reductase/ring-hydroxylating ferredoxin subunit
MTSSARYTARGVSRPFFDTKPGVSGAGPRISTRSRDVIVVGAGIAGLSTAYLLAKEGLDVTVLERGRAGWGMTGGTTGHLVNVLDDRFSVAEKELGRKKTRQAAQSHAAAIDQIESTVRELRIRCRFERLDGYLFVEAGQPLNELEQELRSAKRAGLTGAEWVDHLPDKVLSSGPAIRFPEQAQFDPLPYLAALAKFVERNGGELHTAAQVVETDGGSKPSVRLADGTRIHAKAVVVATNHPLNSNSLVYTRQAPYRTYAVAARIKAKQLPKALYWDMEDPYHYVRRAQSERGTTVALVGGEDHKHGQGDAASATQRLMAWTQERLDVDGFVAKWSGEIMETSDGLALIGQVPGTGGHHYLVTGDSGMGLTHGTIGAMLLSDLIRGRKNSYATLYSPKRALHGVRDFAREQANVARRYAELVLPGEPGGIDAVSRGSGAVLRHGARKVATYRDERGHVHEFSAICAHRGCVVQWNDGEKTWDCPCHGSTYDALGRVIHGPATEDLAALARRGGSARGRTSPRRRKSARSQRKRLSAPRSRA